MTAPFATEPTCFRVTTEGWYGDRLAEPFQPKSISQLQQLLDEVGLTSEFWQLA